PPPRPNPVGPPAHGTRSTTCRSHHRARPNTLAAVTARVLLGDEVGVPATLRPGGMSRSSMPRMPPTRGVLPVGFWRLVEDAERRYSLRNVLCPGYAPRHVPVRHALTLAGRPAPCAHRAAGPRTPAGPGAGPPVDGVRRAGRRHPAVPRVCAAVRRPRAVGRADLRVVRAVVGHRDRAGGTVRRLGRPGVPAPVAGPRPGGARPRVRAVDVPP